MTGAAIEARKALGPGLLESTCQQCLDHELKLNKINFKAENPLPVKYKGFHLDCEYRIGLLVDNKIVLELKSLEQLKGIQVAQLLTYMKLANGTQGFLILM